MADDSFRYWVQRYDKLHLGLLSLLADIFLSVRCGLDMLVLQGKNEGERTSPIKAW